MKVFFIIVISLLMTISIQAKEYEKWHLNDAIEICEEEVAVMSRMVWGEARGLSDDEMRLVIWTVFQRTDSPWWGDTVINTIRQHGQFHGYRSSHPVCPYIRAIVVEEFEKWINGEEPPILYPFAKTRPYYYFSGRNSHNWFREHYRRG